MNIIVLTDNIKSISSKNDTIEVKTTGKNTRQLIGKETEIKSDDEKLTVTKNETNDFNLDLDLSSYYNKTEIDTTLNDYYDKTEIDTTLNDYYDKTEVDTKIDENKTDLSDYYKKDKIMDITTGVMTQLKLVRHDINNITLEAFLTVDKIEDFTNFLVDIYFFDPFSEEVIPIVQASKQNGTLEKHTYLGVALGIEQQNVIDCINDGFTTFYVSYGDGDYSKAIELTLNIVDQSSN